MLEWPCDSNIFLHILLSFQTLPSSQITFCTSTLRIQTYHHQLQKQKGTLQNQWAKSSSGVFSSHLQDIIDIGFGLWAKVDPLLARIACLALQIAYRGQEKIIVKQWQLGVWYVRKFNNCLLAPQNIAAADKAIATIYATHPTPETLAIDLVKICYFCI